MWRLQAQFWLLRNRGSRFLQQQVRRHIQRNFSKWALDNHLMEQQPLGSPRPNHPEDAAASSPVPTYAQPGPENRADWTCPECDRAFSSFDDGFAHFVTQKWLENHTKQVKVTFKRQNYHHCFFNRLPLQDLLLECTGVDCSFKCRTRAEAKAHLDGFRGDPEALKKHAYPHNPRRWLKDNRRPAYAPGWGSLHGHLTERQPLGSPRPSHLEDVSASSPAAFAQPGLDIPAGNGKKTYSKVFY